MYYLYFAWFYHYPCVYFYNQLYFLFGLGSVLVVVSVVVLVGFLESLFVVVLGKILGGVEIRAVYDPVAGSPKLAPLPSFIWSRLPTTILIALMIVCIMVSCTLRK